MNADYSIIFDRLKALAIDQGKSCFNFKEIDEDLFVELGDLVARAAQYINER